MGVNIRSAVSECIRPLSYVAAGGTGVAGGTGEAWCCGVTRRNRFTAASARSGAVSFRANPFLRWQTTSFGMEATVNFSVAKQVYFNSHTMISGTVPGIFPGNFPGIVHLGNASAVYSESI